jgi:hypothetical protein
MISEIMITTDADLKREGSLLTLIGAKLGIFNELNEMFQEKEKYGKCFLLSNQAEFDQSNNSQLFL